MRSFAERIVSERVVISLIVVNTLAIFLRGFSWWREHAELPLFLIDYACTAYFVVELFAKIRLQTPRRLLASGWNRFDLVVVLLSTPMLLSPVLDFESFAVVLVLRLGRLSRFFRLLRFVPDSDRIWSGVERGLKASAGVGFALALYGLVLALAACYLFGETSPEHFGDPLVAFHSIFQVFTVEGWHEISAATSSALPGAAASFARVFFAVAVLTGGILGLSMANAIFIDEMVLDNTHQLEDLLLAVAEEVRALRAEHSEDVARLEARLAALGAGISAARAEE